MRFSILRGCHTVEPLQTAPKLLKRFISEQMRDIGHTHGGVRQEYRGNVEFDLPPSGPKRQAKVSLEVSRKVAFVRPRQSRCIRQRKDAQILNQRLDYWRIAVIREFDIDGEIDLDYSHCLVALLQFLPHPASLQISRLQGAQNSGVLHANIRKVMSGHLKVTSSSSLTKDVKDATAKTFFRKGEARLIESLLPKKRSAGFVWSGAADVSSRAP
jgi:hypothetical protein